jgi:uncharacterized membrane protein YqjE
MTGSNRDASLGQGPGAMVADVMASMSRLVQGEVALAKAEAAERLQSAKQAMVQVTVAVVLGITAANVLAAAAVAALVAMGLAAPWATAIVGAVLLILALGFAQHAARLLRDAGAPPRRTAQSLRRDVETLKTMVKPDATA